MFFFCSNQSQNQLFENTPKLTILKLRENQVGIIGQENLKKFQQLKFLDLEKNDCVDQTFEFSEIEIAHNTTPLIEAILFPFCDESFGRFSRSEAISTRDLVKCGIFVMVLTILLFLIIYYKNRVAGTTRVRDFRTPDKRDSEIRELVSEYVGETTIHGIRYIGQKDSNLGER